jgi:hypothetical protein
MSERGEQQSCLREGNNNHGLLFSALRHDCCSLSEMIVVLLSQTCLLFSLRNDCYSALSDMIVVLLSQKCLLFSSLSLSDMIVVLFSMSERGE